MRRMLNGIDASSFDYSLEIYEMEFENILKGITYCYKMMIINNISLPNNENKIRDILRKNYLNNPEIRNNIGFTGKYNFDREVPEDNDLGKVDIKVITRNTLTEPAAYYVIECKRLKNKNLTGTTGLNAEYIKNGILRFVERKYSAFCRVNGMIGFIVEQMDIGSNIENINTLLENNFQAANTKKKLTLVDLFEGFKHSYFSTHNAIDRIEIKLYHLMFDFSKNMEKSN